MPVLRAEAGAKRIRVLIVDDLWSVRQGLRMRLALESDIDLVGEADDADNALRLAEAINPDVIVMDIALPGMDGLATCARLLATGRRGAVVMLSIHEDGTTRKRAFAAGAAAFVSKHEPVEGLLTAIRAADAAHDYFDPNVKEREATPG